MVQYKNNSKKRPTFDLSIRGVESSSDEEECEVNDNSHKVPRVTEHAAQREKPTVLRSAPAHVWLNARQCDVVLLSLDVLGRALPENSTLSLPITRGLRVPMHVWDATPVITADELDARFRLEHQTAWKKYETLQEWLGNEDNASNPDVGIVRDACEALKSHLVVLQERMQECMQCQSALVTIRSLKQHM
jgi:hypothetical protein